MIELETFFPSPPKTLWKIGWFQFNLDFGWSGEYFFRTTMVLFGVGFYFEWSKPHR